MYVEIRGAQAVVGDPDECRSLDVRTGPGDRPAVDAVLRGTGLGRWDGSGDVELAVAGLRAAAFGAEVGADWPHRWDAMVAYARTKGWLTEDGLYLRAHLVGVDEG
jgi:hypothetical protein